MTETTDRGGRSSALWQVLATLLAASLMFVAAHAKDATGVTGTSAARLVNQAYEAETAGDTAEQFALLREAVRIAPDSELPRWQLGQIRVGDEWMPVEAAQRIAAADPLQNQYRRLREQLRETLDGQVALARWCRKNGLEQEAQFHWNSVLSVQPSNKEALGALDLRLIDGIPMSRAQIEAMKDNSRETKAAAKRLAPTIAKWRRAIASSDTAAGDAAIDEIRAVRDVDAIGALDAVTLGREAVDKHQSDDCRQISLAFVAALHAMPERTATESLVRHAVLSPSADVQSQAAENLRERPLHDHVPQLLSGLAMPIESTFRVTTDQYGCVHYRHSLYREGADNDWSVDASYSVMQHSLPGRDYVYRAARRIVEDRTESRQSRAARMASVALQSQAGFGQTAASVESQVWSANQAAEWLNTRIMVALVTVTGQQFDSPAKWWTWWQDNNEYYTYDHPVDRKYYSGTDERYYGKPLDTVSVVASCFANGTPVWTKTGQQPIETIELGDLVLAQDVNTGELAYKPVIGRTVRPPSPIVKLSFGGEEILATRGHPFWVAGVGWRMAKELCDGAVLHGVTGASRIAAVNEDDEAEAYNLVVADFNTYFVGESGILVHDNTPRRPTRATTPGLAARNGVK